MSKHDMATERDTLFVAKVLTALNVDDIRKLAAERGYELRKKGVKRKKCRLEDADGNAIRNTYAPHVAVTAECYARLWKLYKDAQTLWGRGEEPIGYVLEKRLLLAGEHVVRYLKHEIAEPAMLSAIQRLINPLPKEEYIRKGKAK